MRRLAIADYLVYLAVRLTLCVVQALPLDSCARSARGLGWIFADVLGVRRGVIRDNLKHAFPELSDGERQQVTRQMWEHLFLLAIEMAHAPRKIHHTNWRNHIEFLHREELVRSLLSERPSVIVSGHFGNFELSGYVMGLLGFPSFTIARPLDNRYLHDFINRTRGANGQFIFPKNGSAQQIDALVASGGTLGVLADQNAGPKGCWVNFFGRPASTHKAIALFALANEAPMLVCYCQRQGGVLRHGIGVENYADPLTLPDAMRSVPALTQWYTNGLEAIVRRAPEQYWWVHRRWKGEPARRARKEAA